MATFSNVIKGTIWEDTSVFLMGRLIAHDGARALQADVSAITYNVVDMADTETSVASDSLTVANVIFDTLQTDARWQDSSGQAIDSTGYNFGATIPASAFQTGNRTYRIDINFDMASGDDAAGVYEVKTRKRYTPS